MAGSIDQIGYEPVGAGERHDPRAEDRQVGDVVQEPLRLDEHRSRRERERRERERRERREPTRQSRPP